MESAINSRVTPPTFSTSWHPATAVLAPEKLQVVTERNVDIPMRDGVKLRANILPTTLRIRSDPCMARVCKPALQTNVR